MDIPRHIQTGRYTDRQADRQTDEGLMRIRPLTSFFGMSATKNLFALNTLLHQLYCCLSLQYLWNTVRSTTLP